MQLNPDNLIIKRLCRWGQRRVTASLWIFGFVMLSACGAASVTSSFTSAVTPTVAITISTATPGPRPPETDPAHTKEFSTETQRLLTLVAETSPRSLSLERIDNGTGIIPGRTTAVEARNLSGEPSAIGVVKGDLVWSYNQSTIGRLVEIRIVDGVVTKITLRPSKPTAFDLVSLVGTPDLLTLSKIYKQQHPPSVPYAELHYPERGASYLLDCTAVSDVQCEGLRKTDHVLYEKYFVPMDAATFIEEYDDLGLGLWYGFRPEE